MPDYRLYFLDTESDRIKSVEEFASGSDADAIAEVRRRRDEASTELWRGARRLGRFDPDLSSAGRGARAAG